MTGPKGFWRALALAWLALAVVNALAIPMTPWEFDEPLFMAAVNEYEPLRHHPPPPGYPLLVGMAKGIDLALSDPFTSLRTLSVLASLFGFIILALAFREIAGDAAAVIGTSLFYFSPTMLVHATLPVSDATGLASFATALYFGTRVAKGPRMRDALLFAAAVSLTIGCRPQLAFAALPLLGTVLLLARSWRIAGAALAAFTVVSLCWMAPLVHETGGVAGWIRFETRQAEYFAEHDAGISRSGYSSARTALRFIAHPWGRKSLSIPLLALALAGAVEMMRTKRRAALPLAISAGAYLAIALAIMDPRDAPRYALPSVVAVALFAAAGAGLAARRWPRVISTAMVVLFAIASLHYVWPLLDARRSTPSPPAAAAQFAAKTLPKDAVVVYDLSLWPHATLLLSPFRTMRIDDGMRRHFAGPAPMYLYADGAISGDSARTFSWPDSDAYGKLTRNHYRVVSVAPIPPERRYAPRRGVYPYERTIEGLEWRWLASVAELEIPPLGARRLRVRLGLPPSSGIDSNSVRIAAGGRELARVELRRGGASEVMFELPPGTTRLRFESARSYVPASIGRSLSRDPRALAVKLLDLEQLD